MNKEIHAVTGAFGYSGKYIAKKLIAEGQRVITLTNSPDRKNPFGYKIKVCPFNFDEPEKLEETLHGVFVPPFIGYIAGWIIGKIVNDVMITREEIKGLMANLLYVESPPAGNTKLTEWVQKHSDTLGLKYTSELARRTDRESEYRSN